MHKRLACGIALVVTLSLPLGERDVAATSCHHGSYRVEKDEGFQCGIDDNGSPIWGLSRNCYIRFCDEDRVPDYRGPCSGYIKCPGDGQDSRQSACEEAEHSDICPVDANPSCSGVCDETCGNGLDDNNDGHIDEGCGCSGTEAGCCEGNVGHPVSLSTGSVSTDPMVDIEVPSPSLAMSLVRRWVSNGPPTSSRLNFGDHWQTNFDERLDLTGADILWFRDDGRSVLIDRATGNAHDGFSARIVPSGSAYRLADADGTVTLFDGAGRLRSKTRGGHGISATYFSDEGTFPDCPSSPSPRLCRVVDSRGVSLNFHWNGTVVTDLTLGGATNSQWAAHYTYDATSNALSFLLLSAASPTRVVEYSYVSFHPDFTQPEKRDFFLESAQLRRDVGSTTLIERHDWYDDSFPYMIRGRVRVSIGAGSAIAFRWAYCELTNDIGPLATSHPFCQMGAHDIVTTGDLPEGIGEAAMLDLSQDDRSSGTECLTDSSCPTGQLCWFIGESPPGGRCRPAGSLVTMDKGRVVDQPSNCPTCTGEAQISWDQTNGTRTSAQGQNVGLTSFLYDSSNRVVRTIEHDDDGDANTVSDSPFVRVSNLAYDPASGRIHSTTTTSNYGAGRTRSTTYSYDSDGRILSVTQQGYTRTADDPWDLQSVSRVSTYTYTDGLLASADGPRTDVDDTTTIQYYPASAGNPDDRLRPASMCHSTGTANTQLCQSYSAFNVWGEPGQIVDSNGTVTVLQYDAAGRLLSVVADPAGIALTQTGTYDSSGFAITATDEEGRCRHYTYGAFGTIESILWTSSCATGAAVLRTDTSTVDGVGRTQRTRRQAMGTTLSDEEFDIDDLGNVRTMVFPGLANQPSLQVVRDTNGYAQSDSNEDCGSTDLPTCQRHSFQWGGPDRQMTYIDENDGANPVLVMYDRDGHASQAYLPGGQWVRYEYDDFDRVVHAQHSEFGGEFSVFDESNLLAARFDDSAGIPVQRIWRDALGRQTRVIFGPDVDCAASEAGTLLSETRFFYDRVPTPSACPHCDNVGGRLSRAEVDVQCDPAKYGGRVFSSTEFGYDRLGQTAYSREDGNSDDFPVAGDNALALGFETDLGSRPRAVTFPEGDRYEYHYSSDGILERITDPSGATIADSFAYSDPISRNVADWRVLAGGAQ